MFTGHLRESQQEEITLQEVSGEALQLLIQYCYTGAIELREDTVETLLATACLLQLSTIVNACCTFLARQLHPSNCLGFSLFAEQQGCTALLKIASAYTCQNFMQVWKNQEFFQLDSMQLSNLLKSDDLNVPNEQEVFHALMAWIQFEPESRKLYIPELLALIRLPLLQPSVRRPILITIFSSHCFILILVHSRSRRSSMRCQRVSTACDGGLQMASNSWQEIADFDPANQTEKVDCWKAAGCWRNGRSQRGY